MYADFHTHILPNMDDGSKSVTESIEMLHELKNQGVDLVFLTPHFYANDENIESFLNRRNESYEKLKNSLDSNCPELRLGAEVYYFEGMSKSSELVKLTLDTKDKILLLEMPFKKWSDRMVDEIRALSENREFTLTLAHIDRYLNNLDRRTLDEFRYRGIKIQANCDFFLGPLKRKAIKLLNEGYINYLGTDTQTWVLEDQTLKKQKTTLIRKLENRYEKAYFYNFNIDFSSCT